MEPTMEPAVLPVRAPEPADVPADVPYSFCSQPRSLSSRPKYREQPKAAETEKGPLSYVNIMFDPRVVRGNVLSVRPSPPQVLGFAEVHHATVLLESHSIPSPIPLRLKGRGEHGEKYWPESLHRCIFDQERQSLWKAENMFMCRQLFDFDIEVKPILEVLVGKTVEQALLEVMEEEELAQLWSHQRAFAELRNAEFAELQRLEEQDRRIKEEKERRRLEHLEKLRKQRETAEKIAARAFAQRYLADLIPSVFNNLHDSGFFYDPIERDIETEFLPWLMSEVEETLQKKVLGRTMLDSLIRMVVEKRLDEFSHPPPSAQTNAPSEEPRTADAAPKSGEADAADQPVAEEEETDHPVAEEEETDHPVAEEEETDQPVAEEEEADQPVAEE
ncbi:radial spoke head protein 3 homolog isoform X2 [Taeniopygia guttata]|uniref:radial spoke head protein 3 homolog isoform X2 n=1 Tax=Taeniopygia guttata TaxID=59729 RepID=UPI003BB95F69